MILENAIWSIASRLYDSFIHSHVVAWINSIKRPRIIWRQLRLIIYKKELPRKLEKMPFIYAGIETNILNDFVDVEIDRLDHSTLDQKSAKAILSAIDPRKILKDQRCIAIVGSAGIGKTTFQRHTILEVLSRKAQFLYKTENPVPIYIALKVVPNNGASPIYRFIRDSAPFFGDADHLQRIAKTRGLFLCLDGYDEIALTGTMHNYIQLELSNIMTNQRSHERRSHMYHDEHEPNEKEFYSSLRKKSRIWITSRPQFLHHHPIGPIGKIDREPLDSVATIGIVGIGQNREALVRKIFERYSSNHIDIKSFLNPEYFLQHVDRARDTEIREMSFNPLFLTVMCYNYAQLVLKNKKHDVELAATFDALIIQCIDLLLLDLDEFKARLLTAAQKHAIQNRRNEYIPEKSGFLRYLSGYSYLHDITVFTEDVLKSVLVDFLKTHATDNASDIILTFQEKSSDRPSFVRQLIYCGIFVLVDAARSERFYDFPHRRFREVLAADYFSKPESYKQFVTQHAQRGEAALIELTEVLKKSAHIQTAETQAGALKLILDEMLSRSSVDSSFVKIIHSFVMLAPNLPELTKVVSDFVDLVISMRLPMFETSSRILSLWQAKLDDIPRFQNYIRDRCKQGDGHGVAIGCAILGEISRSSLIELIFTHLDSDRSSIEVTSILTRAGIEKCGDRFGDFLSNLINQSSIPNPGLYQGIFISNLDATRPTIKDIWSKLHDDKKMNIIIYLSLLVEMRQVSENFWASFVRNVEYKRENNSFYEYHAIIATRNLSDLHEKMLGEMFFLGPASISTISNEITTSMQTPYEDKDIKILAVEYTPSGEKKANYAIVAEERVQRVAVNITNRLKDFQGRFLSNFEEIGKIIDDEINSIFYDILQNKRNGITLHESIPFFPISQRNLRDGVNIRARSLTGWKAESLIKFAHAWKCVQDTQEPMTSGSIPRYFV